MPVTRTPGLTTMLLHLACYMRALSLALACLAVEHRHSCRALLGDQRCVSKPIFEIHLRDARHRIILAHVAHDAWCDPHCESQSADHTSESAQVCYYRVGTALSFAISNTRIEHPNPSQLIRHIPNTCDCLRPYALLVDVLTRAPCFQQLLCQTQTRRVE